MRLHHYLGLAALLLGVWLFRYDITAPQDSAVSFLLDRWTGTVYRVEIDRIEPVQRD